MFPRRCLAHAALALAACSDPADIDMASMDAAAPPAERPPAVVVPLPDGGADHVPGATRLHLRIIDSKTREPIPAMVTLFPTDRAERVRFGRFNDDSTPGMGTTAIEVGMGGAMLTWHGVAVWRGEA